MTEIHIDWEGPFQHEQVKNMNSKEDYGIYQIYGYHAVYGADTLLYIGAVTAQDGTFASKVDEKYLHRYWTSDSVSICVGRLTGSEDLSDKDWSEEIISAKKLLIFAHSPAYNHQSLMLKINEGNKSDIPFDTHVFNWGKHKQLLPEASGRRYAREYPKDENFHPYGKR